MKIGFVIGALAISGLLSIGCSSSGEEPLDDTSDDLTASGSFVSRGTGYYPSHSGVEGGFVDRQGNPLHTLQQFLAGQASYVSVAMDSRAFPYGQRLRIHELEAKYGRAITFKVVDTGGAFVGRGRSRMDICVANAKASVDPTINGSLHVDIVSANAPAPPPPPKDPTGDDDAPPADDTGSDTGSSSGGGAACNNTGDCNPGGNGAGMICVSGQCVEGCTANWQCPGATTCKAGHCS
jgi:3D (Asp-Asp-Asp) domain-containing protein